MLVQDQKTNDQNVDSVLEKENGQNRQQLKKDDDGKQDILEHTFSLRAKNLNLDVLSELATDNKKQDLAELLEEDDNQIKDKKYEEDEEFIIFDS